MTRFAVFYAIFLVTAFVALLPAQTSFARGEELFMQNKPQEALEFLESAVSEDPVHVQAFLYLGVTYLQLNRVDDAIAAYKQILPKGGAETARIAFNLGNAYFTKGNYDLALEYYNQAIREDASFSSSYLNRGNALIKTGELQDAVADYEKYLSLEPLSSKREQVVKLISFIKEEFAAEERRRIMEEEAAKAAELARIRAEEVSRAEAERRRRLLQEVTESLQAVADDSRGLSAGTEDVQDYEGEFELE